MTELLELLASNLRHDWPVLLLFSLGWIPIYGLSRLIERVLRRNQV